VSYREDPRLGALQAHHPVRGSSYLGASIMCVVFAVLFVWGAHEWESLKMGIGVLVMLGLGWTFFQEWQRIRTMVLALHEGGFSMTNEQGKRVDFLFDEILLLEARYVPGMLKRGLADEGNRVSLHVVDQRSNHVSLPREMEGFHALGKLLVEKTKLVEMRVLIARVDGR